ncbi:hypothetical protein F0562_012274 [Nyssa sinensis]|uniref:TPR1-like CTLH-containing domain-containing protein n=1 Tax=Nyssa sinensis TaxID=561372 RepID=A0A5J4ZWW4_9ASTE|nr:hypothetical protein F0562_012274 [Nyssa sinensis]
MNQTNKVLIFITLKCLNEESFRETLKRLEQESGFCHNMKYFGNMVLNGNWDKLGLEPYLSGFLELNDNEILIKTLYEIGKQKFLEALDNHDHAKALNILDEELKVLTPFYEDQYRENFQPLILDNFWKNEKFLNYGDTKFQRTKLVIELKKLIEANPPFDDILHFPCTSYSRFKSLLSQCQSDANYSGSVSEAENFDPMDDDGFCDQENLPGDILPETTPAQIHHPDYNIYEDLPMTVAKTLDHCSFPTSMDFHPVQQTLLLVGSDVGDIVLWEVANGKKLFSIYFQVWNIGVCSILFQAALLRDPCVAVNRVLWNPDGSCFGIAYSKHIVQIYSYLGGNDVRQHLEIDSHAGGVNDLAFSHLSSQLYVITCGDDKTIKVWDVATGYIQYIFDEHEASVYSLCPRNKDNVHSFFSTALDGKIKLWLYDNLGSRIEYDAPGHWCTTMSYSVDAKRLFSCGTSKEGESFLVEWDEGDGAIKRIYQGFQNYYFGVVQFDIMRNQFLAIGNDHSIKVWDMDNVNLLTIINANGDLPANPYIRFNKDGTLLAVTANNNKIKILGTADGLWLLQMNEDSSFDSSTVASEIIKKDEDIESLVDAIPRITEKPMIWKLTEINNHSQCQSLRLNALVKSNKISRLIYTNRGNAILALESNGNHLLWEWSTKATSKVLPQLLLPTMALRMNNEKTEMNPRKVVPCFSLSKNDLYLFSASGGPISIYIMSAFKTIRKFMYPQPAATFLALHPQVDNIIAIGMDDSSILIFDICYGKILKKLMGHYKKITGLAFSHVLNVLVSLGADNQILVWCSDGWERKNGKFLQIPTGRGPGVLLDTSIQFHQDQKHFLVQHGTQLAVYETMGLDCVKQWFPGESFAPISHATFSCDGQLVYASFLDGIVGIFGASNLHLQRLINPAAYLPFTSRHDVYPLVIAAHPQLPNQFAVGLSSGEVVVFEPIESEGKWGLSLNFENGSTSSMPTASQVSSSSSNCRVD